VAVVVCVVLKESLLCKELDAPENKPWSMPSNGNGPCASLCSLLGVWLRRQNRPLPGHAVEGEKKQCLVTPHLPLFPAHRYRVISPSQPTGTAPFSEGFQLGASPQGAESALATWRSLKEWLKDK